MCFLSPICRFIIEDYESINETYLAEAASFAVVAYGYEGRVGEGG
jgi:hypothetical protein